MGFLLVRAALLDVLNIRGVNSLLEGSPSSTGYTGMNPRETEAGICVKDMRSSWYLHSSPCYCV